MEDIGTNPPCNQESLNETINKLSKFLAMFENVLHQLKRQLEHLQKQENVVQMWTKIGTLTSGKAIYVSATKDIAVEQDYSFLVEPTEEERKEILEKWPKFRPSAR